MGAVTSRTTEPPPGGKFTVSWIRHPRTSPQDGAKVSEDILN